MIDLLWNDVVCDILEWSCVIPDVWIALESSGYAEQIRGGKSGRTRRSVVSGLQHFVFFSRLNVGEDYHTC